MQSHGDSGDVLANIQEQFAALAAKPKELKERLDVWVLSQPAWVDGLVQGMQGSAQVSSQPPAGGRPPARRRPSCRSTPPCLCSTPGCFLGHGHGLHDQDECGDNSCRWAALQSLLPRAAGRQALCTASAGTRAAACGARPLAASVRPTSPLAPPLRSRRHGACSHDAGGAAGTGTQLCGHDGRQRRLGRCAPRCAGLAAGSLNGGARAAPQELSTGTAQQGCGSGRSQGSWPQKAPAQRPAATAHQAPAARRPPSPAHSQRTLSGCVAARRTSKTA